MPNLGQNFMKLGGGKMEFDNNLKSYSLLDDRGEHAGFVHVNLNGKYFIPIRIERFEDGLDIIIINKKQDFLDHNNMFVEEILDDYVNTYFNFNGYHIPVKKLTIKE